MGKAGTLFRHAWSADLVLGQRATKCRDLAEGFQSPLARLRHPDDERIAYAHFKERRKIADQEAAERERIAEENWLETIKQDPVRWKAHQGRQAWEEAYQRRKDERAKLGVPTRGRLPAGALAAARKKFAEREQAAQERQRKTQKPNKT